MGNNPTASDVIALIEKGDAPLISGPYIKTISSYDKSPWIDASLATVWDHKGNALGGRGDCAEALRAYQNAIDIDTKLSEP